MSNLTPERHAEQKWFHEKGYAAGYRAGVEAMRDACIKEGTYWFNYYPNHFATVASRLLKEKP